MEFNSNITFLLFFLCTFFISVFSAGRVNRTLASCPQNTNTTIMQYPHGAGSECCPHAICLEDRDTSLLYDTDNIFIGKTCR